MVDQATVESGNGRRTREAPGAGLRQSAAGFIHDLAVLIELQAKLFLHDARLTAKQMLLPAALLAVALSAAICTWPIGIVAVAYFLIEAGLRPGWAFLASAGISLVSAALILTAAWALVRKRTMPLARSREEFAKNLTWVKNVLKHSGRQGGGPL